MGHDRHAIFLVIDKTLQGSNKARGASVVIDLYSAWFKSVGVFRNIRSPRDVAPEAEQAAEEQV